MNVTSQTDVVKIPIAINDRVINKSSEFSTITHYFKNRELTGAEIAAEINKGYAIVCAHMKEIDSQGTTHRKSDAFEYAELFGIDIDNAIFKTDKDGKRIKDSLSNDFIKLRSPDYWSFEEALHDPFIQENAYLLYHTPSSTAEWHRFRILFRLPSRATDPSSYCELVSAFIVRLGGDGACKDACRFFYGAKDSQPTVLGNVLSIHAMTEVLSGYQKQRTLDIESTQKKITASKNKITEYTFKGTLEDGNLSPLDAYDLGFDILDILFEFGWTVSYILDQTYYLTRPGKDYGTSATFNYRSGRYPAMRFWCFTSSTQFDPETCYTPSGLYAILLCESDFSRAAKQLALLGYGEKEELPSTPSLFSNSNFDLLHKGTEPVARFLAPLFPLHLYDHTTESWITYENGIWIKKSETIRIQVYDMLVSAIAYEKNVVRESAINQKAKLKKLEALKKLEIHFGDIGVLEKILRAMDDHMGVYTLDFDRNSDQINLLNGVFDLPTNHFLPHHHSQRFYKNANVNFDENARCPRWLNFLNLIFKHDKEIIRYIQKAVGTSLSGIQKEQKVFFCYGTGANGKSTFLRVLGSIFGPYAVNLPSKILLGTHQGADHGYYLAKLHGARTAIFSELEKGQSFQEHHIKQLTGGDKIIARRPCENPFEFNPTHSCWLVGNHRPFIQGNDEGIWRRIALIPFEHTIPVDKRRQMDEVVGELMEESSGILNWMIEGYNLGKKEGILLPEELVEGVQTYKYESDALSGFFESEVLCEDGRYILDPEKYSEPLSHVFQEYALWCKNNGEHQVFSGRRSLSTHLTNSGFLVKVGYGNRTYVHGMKLSKNKNPL